MTGDFLFSLISLWRDWQTLLVLTNVQTHPTDKKQLGGIKITWQNCLISLNHHRKLTSNLHWLYSSLKSPLCWFCASTHPVYCRDMCVMSSLTKPARPRPKCRSTLFVCVEAAAILEEHRTHTYAQPGLLRGWLTEQRLYLHFTDWQIRIMYPLRSTAEPTQSQRHAGFHQADSFF